MPKRGARLVRSSLLSAAIAGCVTPPPTWPLPTGLGGVFGDMVLKIPALLLGGYPTGLFAAFVVMLLVGAGALAVRLRLGADCIAATDSAAPQEPAARRHGDED